MPAQGGGKNWCYCGTCKRYIQSLGIMSHRAMHRRRKDKCEITFSGGDTWRYDFSTEKKADRLTE